MSRLVIVSNRVAPVVESGEAVGGLAVAVLAALQDQGGLWFGWSGRIVERSPDALKRVSSGAIVQLTLDLTQEDYDDYYRGYANQSLWPLLHYRLSLFEYSRRFREGYRRVNELFAQHLLPEVQADDLVWVHDYHLVPLGAALRARGFTGKIGFFLHTPFPVPEILLTLPDHQDFVEALCAYDLVGFQTENDLRAFHDYLRYEGKGQIYADGTLEAYGRRLIARVYPISIDTERFAETAAKAVSSKQHQRFRASMLGRSLLVGVDRLDYSKGLTQRFLAYEQLLERYPDFLRKVVMLQIAPPSRTDVPEYRAIREELQGVAGRINGRFTELDWTPLRYINRAYSRNQLAGILRDARVGVVTPLRDGMNLVAKEYVAAQDPEDPGVLVLSRFAGAARELDAALLVNPFDEEAVTEAFGEALQMPVEERHERWRALYRVIARHDVTAWRRAFVAALTSDVL